MLNPAFIQELQTALNHNLPGRDAQLLMANFGRSTSVPPGARLASVMLLLLYKEQTPFFVLTRRTARYPEDKHSGQISFPGGSLDPLDENMQMAAIRETYEEIGIEPSSINVLGSLTNLYIPVSNFLVHPFVGLATETHEYRLQPDEVEDIIEVPLSMLMNDNTIKTKNIKIYNGQTLKDVPYFDFYGNTVWGATAMILSEFRQVVRKIQAK